MVDLKEKQIECEKILSYSQSIDISDLDLEYHINRWWNNKQRFYHWFGDKLVLKIATNVNIFPDSSRDARFQEFYDEVHAFLKVYDKETVNPAFYTFLTANALGLFDNTVVVSTHPNVTTNSKLTKAFKHFIYEKEPLRYVQDLASRYIQEKKLTGNLYISIDPADFLLMSDTNANWDSCHSLDGEYRAGNLSYMLDYVTFIAYFANEEKENLRACPGDLTHYNKKWRMLVHAHPDMNIVYYNRQYPFFSDTLLGMIHSYMTGLCQELDFQINFNGFRNIQNKHLTKNLNYNHILVNQNIINTIDIINSPDLLYSDLMTSNKYTPIFAIKREFEYKYMSHENIEQKLFMNIGADYPCICKGCTSFVQDSETFMCKHHEKKYPGKYKICTICGSRIYDEDGYFENKDGIFCEECYVREYPEELF